MIPDSIRKMIDDEAKLFASDQVFNRDKFVEKLTEVGSAMGKWSYSLALKEIARLKEDVKELVEGFNKMVIEYEHTCKEAADRCGKSLDDFLELLPTYQNSKQLIHKHKL